jgi:hypothetical protein
MNTARAFLLSASLISTSATHVLAQAQPAPAGMTIRYRPNSRGVPADTNWLEGRVARVTPDTVVLAVCSKCRDPERVLTPAWLYDFQRHSGVGSRVGNARSGALIGALVGTGAVFYSLSQCKPADDLCGLTIILVPPFALGGAVLGALVGSVIEPGRWKPWLPDE